MERGTVENVRFVSHRPAGEDDACKASVRKIWSAVRGAFVKRESPLSALEGEMVEVISDGD